MGAFINTNNLKSQIEYLDEDNQISVNKPQTFQYQPKLHQKSIDEDFYDKNLEINTIEVNHQCFLFFQSTNKIDQLDLDDSRETPSWNIPKITNNPNNVNNPRQKKLQKKQQSKKKQGNQVIQRINLESIF